MCRVSDIMVLLSVLAGMRWHALRWHARVLSGSLILLCEIILVLHGLFSCHTSAIWLLRCHSLRCHASSSWNLSMCIVLRRVYLRLSINTVLVAGRWFGCVQACLLRVSECLEIAWDAKTYLDQILALGLCDERLKLGCGEGVHESGF
jgi:hypothetical protein